MQKNIILTIIIACFFLTSTIYFVFSLTEDEYQEESSGWKCMSSLPLQSGYCEVIGVGRVTNVWQNGKGVFLSVDNYWRGKIKPLLVGRLSQNYHL